MARNVTAPPANARSDACAQHVDLQLRRRMEPHLQPIENVTKMTRDKDHAKAWNCLKHLEFQELRLSKNLALVERLREVGDRVQRLPGQVAIAWALRNPAVTGVIVGERTAKQVEGIVDAATLR